MMIQVMTTTNSINTVVISMGYYLASIRVRANSSRVNIVTRQITVSMILFKCGLTE